MPKTEIRKILGRSPDRYDALALAVWEPMWIRDEEAAADEPARPTQETIFDDVALVMDPYEALKAFQRR